MAGVSPHTRGWTRRVAVEPDDRGGFPAHAGMDPLIACTPSTDPRFPRTRGDGPQGSTVIRSGAMGFPAHAGMDPWSSNLALRRTGFPRTRGDGPPAWRGRG